MRERILAIFLLAIQRHKRRIDGGSQPKERGNVRSREETAWNQEEE